MADVKPLKAGATGVEQFSGSDTIPASLIGIVPKFEVPSGTVNGSNVTFTLSSTPVAAASVLMLLDGLGQTNGTDYTVSGTTVTFTTAPASGTEVVAMYNSTASAAGGDFSSNTGTSVDGEVVLFSGTGGKTGKRATGTGVAKVTSGVLSALTAAQLKAEVTSVITPSQITSDQDNYAPTGWADATLVRLSGDNGLRALSSFSAGASGETKTLINVGSFPLYIPGEHPDGTAANRVMTSEDLILYPSDTVDIFYDSTSSRWRVTQLPTSAGRNVIYAVSASSGTTGDSQIMGQTAIGTGTLSPGASASGYPSTFQLSTASSATAGYIAYLPKSVITHSYFSNAHIWADAFISIPTLSDGTNTFTACVQITNSPTNTTETPNNTVGIRYGSAVNSGKFLGFSRDNAGSESTVDLGITVTAAQLYRLRVEIDKSRTEARFYIDGAMLGRVTGNMPSAVVCGSRVILLKSVGTTARTLNVHSIATAAIYP